MRILLLTQWFQPEPFFKGLPLAKALVARGHEVQVLTGFPNYPGGKIYPTYRVRAWQREILDGIPVLRVPLFPSHDASAVRRAANYLSFSLASLVGAIAGVARPDVVWAYNLVTLAPAAAALRKMHGCPIVLDVQDLWPESLLASDMLRGSRWDDLLRPIADWGYRQMDMIVAQSPGMRQHLIERGIDADKVRICYNWTEESAPVIATPDHAYALSLGLHDTFNVLFAGTMGLVQRLDVVLDAARILQSSASRVQFIFVGDGVEYSRLVQRADALNLQNVRFMPRLPRHEMGRIMSVSHVGLVHLKKDSLFRVTIPSKIQSYLREGLPILAAVEGDAREIVERARAGIACAPEDPEAMAAALAQLTALPAADLHRMGVQGREYYGDEMSFETGIDRLEAHLKLAVAAAKHSSGGRHGP